MSEVEQPEVSAPETVDAGTHSVNTNSAIQFIASLMQKPETTIETVATTAAALGLRLEFNISVMDPHEEPASAEEGQGDDQ